MHFSKHLDRGGKCLLDRGGKCLQVCSYLFLSFSPFLYKGATSANLRHEGKVEDLIELFTYYSSNKV